jgi:hypothetical protein
VEAISIPARFPPRQRLPTILMCWPARAPIAAPAADELALQTLPTIESLDPYAAMWS